MVFQGLLAEVAYLYLSRRFWDSGVKESELPDCLRNSYNSRHDDDYDLLDRQSLLTKMND